MIYMDEEIHLTDLIPVERLKRFRILSLKWQEWQR